MRQFARRQGTWRLRQGVVLVSGANKPAAFTWPLPNQAALVGLHFHQQAVVPDPGAGNPLGAVMSDAATAVIGR